MPSLFLIYYMSMQLSIQFACTFLKNLSRPQFKNPEIRLMFLKFDAMSKRVYFYQLKVSAMFPNFLAVFVKQG